MPHETFHLLVKGNGKISVTGSWIPFSDPMFQKEKITKKPFFDPTFFLNKFKNLNFEDEETNALTEADNILQKDLEDKKLSQEKKEDSNAEDVDDILSKDSKKKKSTGKKKSKSEDIPS